MSKENIYELKIEPSTLFDPRFEQKVSKWQNDCGLTVDTDAWDCSPKLMKKRTEIYVKKREIPTLITRLASFLKIFHTYLQYRQVNSTLGPYKLQTALCCSRLKMRILDVPSKLFSEVL